MRSGQDGSAAQEAYVAGLLYRFRLDEAAQQIDRWLETDPNNTLGLLSKGKLQEVREQSSDALLTYRRLLELDPQFDDVRFRLTKILVQLRQGEEALPHAKYLHRRLPDQAEVFVQLTKALELQGERDAARTVLDECLRLHPDHAAALAERGRIARRDDDSVLAEQMLERAVRLDGSDVPARYQYYLALSQNGKEAEAAHQQEEIRRIETDGQRISELIHGRLHAMPNDPEVPYEIAMIALRAGLPNEGLRWLQNALRIDPNHAPTHKALSAYYYETGNPILSARHRAIAQQLRNQKQP
jgi:tetratricopeptide (TPR) repeat protein